MNHTTINPEKQRVLFDDALREKQYEEALHLISEVQEDGRFPLLALRMTERLDLAKALDARHREEVELDYERWSNYQRDNQMAI